VTTSPAFAFIGHPRNAADIFRASCLSLLRSFSADDDEFLIRALMLPPTLLADVTVGFSTFRGEVISIAALPIDVMTQRGRREIERAVALAAERGACVVGLGALTSPATAGGLRIVDRVPAGVTVTNGNAYTAAVLAENVDEAAERVGSSRPSVAVVGCTGSVGTAVSRLLAHRGFDLHLIARSVGKARRLLGDLEPVARYSDDVTDSASADIVLLLTDVSPETLDIGGTREDVVVIDAAEPSGWAEEDLQALAGRIEYARGGRALIPGYRCSYDFGLSRPEETFACLAETYLFVRDGVREHSVGSPTADDALRMSRIAQRHGVSAAPLVFREHEARPRRRSEYGVVSPG
jgi:fatty aldehyde-generating acyl-ACP reductase